MKIKVDVISLYVDQILCTILWQYDIPLVEMFVIILVQIDKK